MQVVDASGCNARLLLAGVTHEDDLRLLRQHESEVLRLYFSHAKPNGFHGCVVFTPRRKPKGKYLLNVKEDDAASRVIDNLEERKRQDNAGVHSCRVVVKRATTSYADSAVYLIPIMAAGDSPGKDQHGNILYPARQLTDRICKSVRDRFEHSDTQ